MAADPDEGNDWQPKELWPFAYNDAVQWRDADGTVRIGAVITCTVISNAELAAEHGRPIGTVMVLVETDRGDHHVPHGDLRKVDAS